MKKTLLALFVVTTSVQFSKAQYSPHWENGDTLFFAFNKDMKAIDNLKACTYYRQSYPASGNKYVVIDFYNSGQVKRTAVQSHADPVFNFINNYGEVVEYFDSGDTLSYSKFDRNGLPIGRHYEKYPNGMLKSITDYSNPKQISLEQWFYENGELKAQRNYFVGDKIGEIKAYDQGGNLKGVATFEKKDIGADKDSFYRYNIKDSDGELMLELDRDSQVSESEIHDLFLNETSDVDVIDSIDITVEHNEIHIEEEPKPIKSILSEIQSNYKNLPKDFNITNGRGVYNIRINEFGIVDSVIIVESISDYSDKLITEALKNVGFVPGISNGGKSIFSQSLLISIVKGKIVLTQGDYILENKSNSESSESDLLFALTEVMPSFPGGEEEMSRFLSSNINYPVDAKQLKIQGVVYVAFTVNKYGIIQDILVLKGVHPSIDLEAIRVIGSMPKWEPGTQRGENVNVIFTTPLRFMLK